ncbi:hypothetical protein [Agrobacterium sp. MCAB5]|uniref:hypothetical protein n=1 Tax=Agrobacterium sp. MCAB5 TaxID=3233042 RepID=UPI003F8FC99C
MFLSMQFELVAKSWSQIAAIAEWYVKSAIISGLPQVAAGVVSLKCGESWVACLSE